MIQLSIGILKGVKLVKIHNKLTFFIAIVAPNALWLVMEDALRFIWAFCGFDHAITHLRLSLLEFDWFAVVI